jgi:hypothetical protein
MADDSERIVSSGEEGVTFPETGLQSQLKNLMVRAIGVDGIVQLSQKIPPVARQEVHGTDATLLQALVGIQSLAEMIGVARY